MAGFFGGKMKRKEFKDEDDYFSFPAVKIRRLDGELMPYIEGNEVGTGMEFDKQVSTDHWVKHENDMEHLGYAIPQCSTSDERALVVYKPMDCSSMSLSSDVNVPFRVSFDLIDGIKNYNSKIGEQSITRMDEKIAVHDNNLALVPWVPSRIITSTSGHDTHTECSGTLLDHEEAEAASMDVDEYTGQTLTSAQASEAFHQWQQLCLTTQVLPIGSNAITWSM